MKNNVHNGQRRQRHKCSICGCVRFESKMEKIMHRYNDQVFSVKTRFGNDCWVCVDNPDCQHKAPSFYVY